MARYRNNAGQWLTSLTLAASFLFSGVSSVWADPPLNQTYNGRDIAGGTYYNTPTGKTTFTNTKGTGLYIKAGDTVAGREYHNGAETGNGGNLLFYAPKQVVKFDGNVDVRPFVKGGGSSGNVEVVAGAFYQNGQIYAGNATFNVTSMTMGPNAGIYAKGLNGPGTGGTVTINAKNGVTIPVGAIIDTSGAVIGGFNTNVISIKGGVVNLDGVLMANGLNPGQQGGKVSITATDSVHIGADGKILANGADGAKGIEATENTPGTPATDGGNGGYVEVKAKAINNDGLIAANGGNGAVGEVTTHGGEGGEVTLNSSTNIHNNGQIVANGGNGGNGNNPANGANGGTVTLSANKDIHNNGLIAANGGQGGTNPDVARGDWYMASGDNGGKFLQQYSHGQDGAKGGHGGNIDLHFKGEITNNGAIEVKGGNGGDGQIAMADTPIPSKYADYKGYSEQVAYGGIGGDAGNGGHVRLFGNPSQDVLNSINVSGGSGGQGGAAATSSSCGCAYAGAGGACGNPGTIEVFPYKPPTTTPPRTVLVAPYPREYANLGDTLPPGASQVLNYNRSIFLARSPMPIIQKKPVAVVPPPPPAPEPVKPAPKPKPVQKKATVRGFW